MRLLDVCICGILEMHEPSVAHELDYTNGQENNGMTGMWVMLDPGR